MDWTRGLEIERYDQNQWSPVASFHFSDSSPSALSSLRSIFRISLRANESVMDLQALLTSDEQARATAFHVPEDRDKFIRGRAGLRVILGEAMQADPAALRFTYGEHGKPRLLVSGEGSGIEFNVSHSGAMAIVAVSWSGHVGVDVEFHREDVEFEKLARRFFSDSDCARLLALPQEDVMTAFYRCWTRKEAYIKAVGTGLALALRSFDVAIEAGATSALLATRPVASEKLRWQLDDVAAGEGYAAAVCWEKRPQGEKT